MFIKMNKIFNINMSGSLNLTSMISLIFNLALGV